MARGHESRQVIGEYYPEILYGAVGVATGLIAMRLLNRAEERRQLLSPAPAVDVQQTITINCSIVDVFQAWRGRQRDWDIIDEKMNDYFVWRTPRGMSGEVGGVAVFRRAPGGRGTELGIRLHYPSRFAKSHAVRSGQTLREELRRLKQVLETGEIATIAGQARGGTR